MTCGCICCVVEGVYPPGVVGVFLLRAGGVSLLGSLVFLKELVFLCCTISPLPVKPAAREFVHGCPLPLFCAMALRTVIGRFPGGLRTVYRT